MTAAKKVHPDRPILVHYHDYREFLRDWLDYLRSSQSQFSLRAICRRAQIAPSFLSMVLSGKRNLTEAALQSLWPHLHLPDRDRSFFESQVRIADSPSTADRILALRRLQRSQEYRRQNQAEVELYQYLTKWYFVAIRELAFCSDFVDDPDWIQARLAVSISPADIREALKFLKHSGMLVQEHGRWRPGREVNLDCESGVFRLSLAEFHQQILDLAKLAITHVPRTERYLVGQTIAVTASGFAKIKDVIDRTREEIIAYEQQDHGHKDRVYHVELCAIPLARPKGVKNEND